MDALILAAGRGTRMGGRKARLLWGGVPLALAHVRGLRSLGAERVLVVANAADLTCIGAEADAVASDAPDAAGSLGVGVRALGLVLPSRAPVLVVPVDSLPVSRVVLGQLLAALGRGALAAVPTFHGRGGHPVLVRATALAPYADAALTAPPPLRDVLRALGERRVEVAVDEAFVALDLDTPEEVLRVTGGPPRFLDDGDR